ncbi:Atypical/RIO/RIO2 protein kinase [Anncaliia algerae PRA339]|uniref:non-specific serine/threonine protein kinase n=1 Tax=Anncaliia algerae PRA339 TaxID=1288291 RepID=A0A059EZB1_9MICR|nr:Atypical/RIO/RIO2 protein kinase [Anncaliia algerae PRA339]
MLQRELFTLNSESIKLLKLLYNHKKVSLKKLEKLKISIKLLYALVKKKFLKYEAEYYSLTIHGYDAIALNELKKKGLIRLGDRIGTGKEADIYIGRMKIKSESPVNIFEEKYDLNGNLNTFYENVTENEEELNKTLKELTSSPDSTDISDKETEIETEEVEKPIEISMSQETNVEFLSKDESCNNPTKKSTNEMSVVEREEKEKKKIDFEELCNNKEQEIEEVLFEDIKEEEESLEIKLGGYIRNSIDIESINKRHLEFTSLTKEKIENNRETLVLRSKKEKVIDVIVKFHRLGRTSFKAVKNKRDYKENNDWHAVCAKSAELEGKYMKKLNGLSVPKFYYQSYHLVIMEYLDGYTLLNDVEINNKEKVYNSLCYFLIDLYNIGLIHGDFNEFNILIGRNEEIKVIDFPQMISVDSSLAYEYLKRDYKCINEYFKRKYQFIIKSEEIEKILNDLKNK